VAGWTGADGVFQPRDLPEPRQIMEPETADTVLQMLVGAIDSGIANGAAVPGYSIAGKTGTAQVAGPVTVQVRTGWDAAGNPIYEETTRQEYIEGWVDSSFIGILPAGDRKLVTLVLLHRPGVWGRYQMAERPETVYARLMPQILSYLAIPPDRPAEPVARP
jgi:cell division protein FtsI/penicillin-binding protein 2